jgi:hypothetical protein
MRQSKYNAVSLACSNPRRACPSVTNSPEPTPVDLRDPYLAAFLAWLLPGAGHFYQRRYGKGGLFMTCILGLFFFGLYLGGGKVVYASWRQGDQRYAYLCQVGVGLPALPALVQSTRVGGDAPNSPLWGGFMAPPLQPGQPVNAAWAQRLIQQDADRYGGDAFLRSPDGRPYVSQIDELSDWHDELAAYFELGTFYTMVAGLLNVLVIYDAFAGPVVHHPRRRDTEEQPASDAAESAAKS